MIPEFLQSWSAFGLLITAVAFFIRIEGKLNELIDSLEALERRQEDGKLQSTKEHEALMKYCSKKFDEMERDHDDLKKEQLTFNTEVRAMRDKK